MTWRADRWLVPITIDTALIAACVAVCLFGLAEAPVLGPVAYMAPVGAIAILCVVVAVAAAVAGNTSAIAAFVGFAILVPDLSFRTREVGDSGLDWQNGAKFATWAVMLVITARHGAMLAKLIGRDLGLSFVFAFACFALASAAWSPVPAYTAACAIGTFAWLGLAAVIVLRLPEPTFLRILLWTLAVEIALGIAGGILVPDLAWMPPSAEESGYRLQGFSGHANLLAQHAALLLLAITFAYEDRLVRKGTALVLLVMGVGALVATNSKTTLLAVTAAWLAASMRGSRYLGIVAIVIVVAIVAAVGLQAMGSMPDFNAAFGSLSRTGSASEITTLTGRTDLWAIAWVHFLQKPILGWGYNGTELLMSESVSRDFAGNPVNAHNVVLQGLMSIGIVGSLPVFGYMTILVRRFFSRPDAKRDHILVYAVVLGTAEAEMLTVPAVLSFLLFWILARDAIRGQTVVVIDADPKCGAPPRKGSN